MAKRKLLTFTTTFEEFVSSGVIGQGGTGIVHRVSDSKGREFAAKLLDAEHAHGARLARFKNELTCCVRNKHPNILCAIDHGVVIEGTTKSPFYIMPLYDGSLRSLLKQKVPPKDMLTIFLRILDGMEAAHKQGIIHRDLKPENILISGTGKQVAVADFGIAHFQEEDLRTAVETKSADRLANFQYASPEQRMRGSAVDQRSDIYSLGLMLNELFTNNLALGTGYAKIVSVSAEHKYLDEIVEELIDKEEAPDAKS